MLAIHPCLKLCDWGPTASAHGASSPTSSSYDETVLLACHGCGSEWTRAEPWTPRQADGSVPAGVRDELQRG